MTYYVRFECSPYHPNQEMRNWIIDNDVTLHSVRDAGMYGNRDIYYSSPTLTGGHVRIGHGYDSKFSNSRFSHTDPVDLEKFANRCDDCGDVIPQHDEYCDDCGNANHAAEYGDMDDHYTDSIFYSGDQS